ncbi:class A beta-lactamase [Bradyrhizobium manausense]|uniref:class A beta-lactamase n=1 Tax=Bradyrhizobium TaxID=374 RepID=UPI001BA66E97|nr:MULTISPECIES: class A beta-lactamase [Bradyrhizobium]MBR0831076.1 class A beta-lactamase [Bradyrhizobium manausense]UVO29113.1 class A beta-lactamase [Bradyrhizobium arachidis]
MTLDRRSLLAGLALMAVGPARAQEAPPELEAYERQSGGKIGVHAENLLTGAKLSWRADERFVMCSTFKASLAACVLSRVDRGEEKLDAMISYGKADLLDYAPAAKENLASGAMSVTDMCKAIVEISDNTCANLLLARIGGPAKLTAFWRSIGDNVSRLDHDEPELNRSPPGDPNDTTTPAAMIGNLRRLVIGDALSATSRAQLTEWMVNCKTGANRLRGGLPSSWRIGDKTGNNGRDASGDIAVAWPKPDAPILIAAYTQGGKPDAAQLQAVFAGVGRMVAQKLG